MKIKEVLEKAKALMLEEGKFYVILIKESPDPEAQRGFINWFDEELVDRGVDAVVITGDDLNDFRIFELEKKDD